MDDIRGSYERLIGCFSAEDVFGGIPAGSSEEMIAALKETRRYLLKSADPAKYEAGSSERWLAEESRRIIEGFFPEAEEKIGKGIYDAFAYRKEAGKKIFTIKTNNDTYHLVSLLAEGDIASVYRGYSDTSPGRIAIKLVRSTEDNDLMNNEAAALSRLRSKVSPQTEKHLSRVIDRFAMEDGRIGLIFDQFNGYDLRSVHEEHPLLDQKDMVWMMNRSLSALGYAHSMSVIHGCITPEHIMIRPSDHNARIVDWCFSAIDPGAGGDGFKAFVEGFSPPEAEEKKSPLPSADIYSLGKCMIYLLGGDIMTLDMPDTVDRRMQNFLRWCTLDSALQRPQDAWSLRRQLVNLIEDLWGPRKFRDLRMPPLR